MGSLEAPLAALYRSFFIDLAGFAELVASTNAPGGAPRVLEVGCGDGLLAARLLDALPTATLVGIDIAPEPGRLFDGDRTRAQFRSMTSSELRAEHPDAFDIVVLCDVLHHVALDERDALLADMAALAAPGATIVVKDWERGRNLAHALAYGSDRYVSGDRGVHFGTALELRQAMSDAFGAGSIVVEARVPPRRNNLAFVIRRA
jgi:2-polyprenyl-6-hydroxyphenyl methylase/3-demethylubiquinone-9 3-methyltransferase